jgi:SAM-dependent methyltransferase
MRDFYGGRQWILKHTPRFGKVIEAGCGLGRYVFYLSRLGIDIEGIDFHEPTVANVESWARANALDCEVRVGDVTELPYERDSISGYLSFGVVEHFVEGPHKALEEACRILRPGGIAIITTPSVSFSQVYLRSRRRLRDVVKRLIGRPVEKPPFAQYWYTARQLASYVRESGLKVVASGGGDLIYSMWELGVVPKNGLIFGLLGRLENTLFSRLGAQSFTVSVKKGPQMFCFLCGRQNVRPERLSQFTLPICEECGRGNLACHYRPGERPRFHAQWEFEASPKHLGAKTCHYCGNGFRTDELFEDLGFLVPVCPSCLREPRINIELSNKFLRPVWRMVGRGTPRE